MFYETVSKLLLRFGSFPKTRNDDDVLLDDEE